MKISSTAFSFTAGFFLAMPIFLSQAQVVTEYPPPSEIKAPSSMGSNAQERFYRRLEQQTQESARVTRVNPEFTTSIQAVPVRIGRFASLRNAADRLLSMGENFTTRKSAIESSDISNTLLNDCRLIKSFPSGPQLEGSVAGNTRFFDCPDIGIVSLEESLLYSDRHVNTINSNSVNARIVIGKIKRGVVISRISNEAANDGVTRIQWRSGDKNRVLRVEGFDDAAAEYAQRIVENFLD